MKSPAPKSVRSETTLKAHHLSAKQQPQQKGEEPLPTIDDALDIYYAGKNKTKVKTNGRGKPGPVGFKKAIPPWKTSKERVLTKRETNMYKHIAKVYGDDITKSKKTRQSKFYMRLENLQEEQSRRDAIVYREAKDKEAESRAEHLRQLKRLRNKFQDEQIKRFMSQYVCF